MTDSTTREPFPTHLSNLQPETVWSQRWKRRPSQPLSCDCPARPPFARAARCSKTAFSRDRIWRHVLRQPLAWINTWPTTLTILSKLCNIKEQAILITWGVTLHCNLKTQEWILDYYSHKIRGVIPISQWVTARSTPQWMDKCSSNSHSNR